MTENQAVTYVGQHGRYYSQGLTLPSGKKGGRYAVNFRGALIHSNDTRRLVTKLTKLSAPSTRASNR